MSATNTMLEETAAAWAQAQDDLEEAKVEASIAASASCTAANKLTTAEQRERLAFAAIEKIRARKI